MEVIAVIRDIAIIIMALMWIVLLGVLIFILLKVWGLVNKMPDRVAPFLETARHTATTVEETAVSVKGAASFFNRTAVTPVIRIAAIGAATTRFLQVLFGRHRREGADNG